VFNETWQVLVVLPVIVYLLLLISSSSLIPGFATRPVGDIRDADCYVVMGFGYRIAPGGAMRAGESNQAIAEFLLDLNEEGKPAIVQYGVLLALKELVQEELKYAGRDLGWVISLPHDPDFYVDTWDAGLQSWALMNHHDLHQAALIAHPDQLKRVAVVFRQLPFKEPSVVPEMPPIPYDRRSVQFWTRSRRRYCPFEVFFSRPRTVLKLFLF
jgi:hypothetical protein